MQKQLEQIFFRNFAFDQASYVVAGRVRQSYWNPEAEHTVCRDS